MIYWLALAVVRSLQALPLRWVARIGRAGGALAYSLDARHRRVALRNLDACFGREQSPSQLRRIARENFRRLGENYACAIKTASMTWEALRPHCEFVGVERLLSDPDSSYRRSHVVAIGHFGNFELYARLSEVVPTFRCATTYRGIRPESLNRLLLNLRERSGCQFFERRSEAEKIKQFMHDRGVVLGLLADQHSGTGGLRLPFFGRDCSTTSAPAVFAQRYDGSLHTGICYRVGLAQWRIELGDEIPLTRDGTRRTTEDMMLEVNRAFEAAVRRDPANWFWVHNRWKPAPARPQPAPLPTAQPA